MKTPHKHAEMLRALADGHELQWRFENSPWADLLSATAILNLVDGEGGVIEYRIKPETRRGWYRVALMRNGATFTADTFCSEDGLERDPKFSRWLTLRTEYEA